MWWWRGLGGDGGGGKKGERHRERKVRHNPPLLYCFTRG